METSQNNLIKNIKKTIQTAVPPIIQKAIQPLKDDITILKKDVTGLKDDITILKKDVTGLKDDVTGLKKDFTGLKKDFTGLKEDLTGLKDDLEKFRDKCFETFVTKEDLRLFKEEILEAIKFERDTILTSNDKIANEQHTIRQEQIIGADHDEERDDKIEKLDTRVTVIETKLHLTPATA